MIDDEYGTVGGMITGGGNRSTYVLGENLPQCNFVDHEFHLNWSELESRPPQ
jgi:hypothetical protein